MALVFSFPLVQSLSAAASISWLSEQRISCQQFLQPTQHFQYPSPAPFFCLQHLRFTTTDVADVAQIVRARTVCGLPLPSPLARSARQLPTLIHSLLHWYDFHIYTFTFLAELECDPMLWFTSRSAVRFSANNFIVSAFFSSLDTSWQQYNTDTTTSSAHLQRYTANLLCTLEVIRELYLRQISVQTLARQLRTVSRRVRSCPQWPSLCVPWLSLHLPPLRTQTSHLQRWPLLIQTLTLLRLTKVKKFCACTFRTVTLDRNFGKLYPTFSVATRCALGRYPRMSGFTIAESIINDLDTETQRSTQNSSAILFSNKSDVSMSGASTIRRMELRDACKIGD